MPRPQKSLEEQLRLAEEELQRALERADQARQRIESIKSQIEDRDMREAYALLKAKGISVDRLSEILSTCE